GVRTRGLRQADHRQQLGIPQSLRIAGLDGLTLRLFLELLEVVGQSREQCEPLERTPHPEGGEAMLALSLLARTRLEPVQLGEIAVLEAVAQLHGNHAAQRVGGKWSTAHALAARERFGGQAACQHRRRQQNSRDAQSPTIERKSGMSSRVRTPTSSPAGF